MFLIFEDPLLNPKNAINFVPIRLTSPPPRPVEELQSPLCSPLRPLINSLPVLTKKPNTKSIAAEKETGFDYLLNNKHERAKDQNENRLDIEHLLRAESEEAPDPEFSFSGTHLEVSSANHSIEVLSFSDSDDDDDCRETPNQSFGLGTKTSISTATCSPDITDPCMMNSFDEEINGNLVPIESIEWPDIGAEDGLFYDKSSTLPSAFAPFLSPPPHNEQKQPPSSLSNQSNPLLGFAPFQSPRFNKALLCDEKFDSPIYSDKNSLSRDIAFTAATGFLHAFEPIQSSPLSCQYATTSFSERLDLGDLSCEETLDPGLTMDSLNTSPDPATDHSEENDAAQMNDLSHLFEIKVKPSKSKNKPDKKWLAFICETVKSTNDRDGLASPFFYERDLQVPVLPKKSDFLARLSEVSIVLMIVK